MTYAICSSAKYALIPKFVTSSRYKLPSALLTFSPDVSFNLLLCIVSQCQRVFDLALLIWNPIAEIDGRNENEVHIISDRIVKKKNIIVAAKAV